MVFHKIKMLEKLNYIKKIVVIMILSTACSVIQHTMDYGLEYTKRDQKVSSAITNIVQIKEYWAFQICLYSKAVTACISYSAWMGAKWAFSFQYFMTAFNTPATFGEEPMAERKQKFLYYFNPIVLFLNLLVPLPFWIAYVIG